MAIYALAAMRALGSPRAEVQLSFLRSHVYPTERRTIRATDRVEERMLQLAQVYVDRRHASEVEPWPRIAREQCELARCGFRPLCWGRQGERSGVLRTGCEGACPESTQPQVLCMGGRTMTEKQGVLGSVGPGAAG